MNYLYIFVTVFVVGVASSPCNVPPPPPSGEQPTATEQAPVKTGLVGTVGYNVVGSISEKLYRSADGLVQSDDPISNLLGAVLQAVGKVGVLAGDEVVGQFAGKTVNQVADILPDPLRSIVKIAGGDA